MSASPLIVDGLVVVLPGGGNGRSVAAYDAQTGDIVWTALSDVQGYTAPMLVELAGVRQILVVTAERAAGLRVDDGTLLWEFPWVTSSGPPNISLPVVVGGNRVFLSAGYGHGGALFEVTGSGGRLSTRELWRTTRMKNRFSTSVLYEGYLYGLDESILACLDAETGELAWKGGRYGHGQVLLADGHLVVLTERGDLVLVRATPEGHEEVARFDAISGKTWNPPTIADGRLYVRNTTEMAAFDIAP
jgi:outer membrane protein assembly factor BamB